jgi:hypothetical protein
MFGLLFRLSRLFNNYDKNVLGYILGDFLTNSSGHPAAESIIRRKKVSRGKSEM